MYGIGSSKSRSSRPSTSTSTAAQPVAAQRSSSDGQVGPRLLGREHAARRARSRPTAPRPASRRARSTSRSPGASGPSAATGRRASSSTRGTRRHRVEAVDLAVGMGDGGADLGAAVLEHEHVVDVVAAAERRRALGPQVDDLAGAAPAPSDANVASWSGV